MADNVAITAGAGTSVATDDIGGIQHQRIKVGFGVDGTYADISDSNPMPVTVAESATYQWIVPSTAVGSNKIFLDFFNAAGSGKIMRVEGIYPIIDTDVAVVGALGIRIVATRTNTVGTGGTAWVKNGLADVAGGAWIAMDTNDADIPANITGRHLSTAGATDQAWLRGAYLMGEESANSFAYLFQGQFNIFDTPQGCKPIILREGFGVKIRQGAVAATGNVRFRVVFTLI